MLAIAVGTTLYSLTYIPTILLIKNYLLLVGIAADFVGIWALVQILRWKKIGVALLIGSIVVSTLITAIDQPNAVASLNQAVINIAAAIVFSLVELGILYLLMRPVWGEFK